MKQKISAVYQIVNTVTNDKYVGSSKDVKKRWANHKCPYTWKQKPNSPLYQDMQKYGLENFRFQILAPVEPEHLKQVEQEFIEMLRPSYNDRRANELDVGRYKEAQKEYQKKYYHTKKGKENRRKGVKKYYDQLCLYNGETLKLNALRWRLRKAGVPHSTIEAKKYLLQ